MIYVAYDGDDLNEATALAKLLFHEPIGIKLGMTFFAAHGGAGVRKVHEVAHQPIFLDMKYHDIPVQVAGAIETVCRLPIAIVNVHASGGSEMMAAAKKARDVTNPNVSLIAVTVLTSLGEDDRNALGWAEPSVEKQVVRWAKLTQSAGLDGVVCAPLEIDILRKACGAAFQLVTPGVRPAQSDTHDHKRTLSPREATQAGATHLVIGRPIMNAPDRLQATRTILAEIQMAAA